jgi:hypothetical protein
MNGLIKWRVQVTLASEVRGENCIPIDGIKHVACFQPVDDLVLCIAKSSAFLDVVFRVLNNTFFFQLIDLATVFIL